jgi:hypothetical protein
MNLIPRLIPRCFICQKGIRDEFYLVLHELAPKEAVPGELATRFGFLHYQCIGADGRLAYLRSPKRAKDEKFARMCERNFARIAKRSINKQGPVKTKRSQSC